MLLKNNEAVDFIKKHQSEIVDKLQRVLEQMTLEQLESPIGKDKVKKVIRHQINEFLQGNFVVGVYYRSVLIDPWCL